MPAKMIFPDFYQATLTPREEIEHRILAFQEILTDKGLEDALIYQNVDLFYLCGTMQQGFLLVPSHGEPLLLVKKDLSRAQAESPLPQIKPLPSLGKLADTIMKYGYHLPDRIGLELDVLPVNTLPVPGRAGSLEEGRRYFNSPSPSAGDQIRLRNRANAEGRRNGAPGLPNCPGTFRRRR